jgi:hypothetical protein
LEIGLQSIHDKTLTRIHRGHDFPCFEKTLERCAGKGFQICVHVILGLPGENYADMMETAQFLASSPINSLKIHNLYVARKTLLAHQFKNLGFNLLSKEEYIETVCDFLEILPPEMTIQRLCADIAPEFLIAPRWCEEKPQLLRKIRESFLKRNSYQGFHHSLRIHYNASSQLGCEGAGGI